VRRGVDVPQGGACLTGHETDYKPNSCSYRWQALTESKLNRKALNVYLTQLEQG
jgi:hypothetical protein